MKPVKRKVTNRSLAERCKALKGLENGLSNKDVATKYGVLRITFLTWVKNKHKLTASLEKKGMNSSRNNTRCGNIQLVCQKKKPKNTHRWYHNKRESLGICKSIGCYRIQSIRLMVE